MNKSPIEIALSKYGEEAIPGARNNPEVVALYAQAGHPEVQNDEVPWCAAFMGAVLKAAGYPNSGSLTARSYEKMGVSVAEPEVGDICIFWRISPESGFGHVGFFIRDIGPAIWVLGGNQENRVEITLKPKSQLLGFRRMTIT